jgi:hypothetical protein
MSKPKSQEPKFVKIKKRIADDIELIITFLKLIFRIEKLPINDINPTEKYTIKVE